MVWGCVHQWGLYRGGGGGGGLKAYAYQNMLIAKNQGNSKVKNCINPE